MPNFDIIRTCSPEKSFRVASVMGRFDMDSNKIQERFTGSIDFPEKWSIGLIVGASGTGKTTIAKELFYNSYVVNFDYKCESVIDDMPKSKSVDEIVSMFNSVGFSSPPSWLKSYSVLSNGQKMRVDLANSLLQDSELVVFDEFTSVVDRNVAKIGSSAVQKAIRKTDKKFIAVSCHCDIEEWLLPDWVLETDTMTFRSNEGQKKNRPEIKFEIFQTNDKSIWKAFAQHHYLSHYHNNAANVYVGFVNDQLASFISVLHFPHATVKNIKKVHRLVVLPDFQGIGIGIKMLEIVGNHYLLNGNRYIITTSSPSLVHALKKSNKWICLRIGRTSKSKGKVKGTSENRITLSFELIKIENE